MIWLWRPVRVRRRTASYLVEAKRVLVAGERRIPHDHAGETTPLSLWIIRRKLEPTAEAARAAPAGLRPRMVSSSNGDGGEHVHERAAGRCRQEGQEQKQSHVIAVGAHDSRQCCGRRLQLFLQVAARQFEGDRFREHTAPKDLETG